MTRLQLSVNGCDYQVTSEPHRLLLDVLRQDLGLTGSKRGCDDSSCGACTVLVDGVPMLACTLLAASCEGRPITTVEGIADPGHLVAIQKAYGDCGGAQCGFCTPGFMMTLHALLQSNPNPTHDEVRAALSGNLCRCTGYTQMYEAIEGEAAPAATSANFSVIGKPTALIDAPSKTTGAGKYTDDLSVPGMLIGKILHSPHAHARIKRIDASRALALEGVVTVVTGTDAPNQYGILPIGHDESALAVDKVRYVGDNVACVVAISERIAEQALEFIDVEYEPLAAWFDPEESMNAESDLIHAGKLHNIEKEYHHVFGDPEKGFAEAEHVVEGRYFANEVTHAAMEPHSTLAQFEGGQLTVWSSTQVPYYLQHKLSIVLEMPMSQIRVIKPLVGGGFGGKSEVIPLEITAAVAARKAKAPVKITYTREEVFWAHRGRPRTIVQLKTGVRNDGAITAVAARVIQDGGAYCSYGVVTILYSGALLGALYDIPNIRFDGYRVLTNKPACGAMRGHGTVNVRFAFESQLDELAARIGMDPAEVRRKNLLKPPCITVNSLRVQSYGLPECIEQVVQRSNWRKRKGKLPRGRGLGIACSHYVSGAANSIIRSEMPHSTVEIHVERGGTVVVYTGESEIGQGSDTMVAQIAAEALGCPLSRVTLVAADTARTPVDIGSYSSRVTFMNGNATLRAAHTVRQKIADAGADSLPFDAAVAKAIEFHGDLKGTGSYTPPADARGGTFKGAGVGPSPAYSYSAQVAEVSVDEETGAVTVHKIWAAHDCGRALNPVAVRGQVIGSVWMGLGQALQEEMVWNGGLLMNPGLLEYRTPSAAESPEIEAIIVESVDPEGPFGAKECSEGSLAAAIPAIANAIYDAVGVRLHESPFTPERVLAALRGRKRAQAPRDGAKVPAVKREQAPALQILRPRDLDEAVTFLNRYSREIQILAGGTDLIPSLRQRLFTPQYLLDIRGLAELRGIRATADGLEIGALTSLCAIEHSAEIRRQYPVLAEAAATISSPVLRNMGTIGGNICLDTRCLWYNQSLQWRKSCGFCIKKDGDVCHVAPGGKQCWAAFSADTPPALLCLDAEIEVVSAAGARRIPLKDFYTGAGDARMKLKPGELLTRVLLPASAAELRGAYRKLRVRGSIDYPVAGVAVAMKRSNGSMQDVRVAITAVNPAPVLVLSGGSLTEETAPAVADLAARAAKPLTTSALTPDYRREMIRVLARRALLACRAAH